jgi:hypothetical protein
LTIRRPDGLLPGISKTNKPGAPTFEAWTMAGGQRGGLVEKEELRVTIRRHDLTLSAPELRQADHPVLYLERTADSSKLVVKLAAVAHKHSALRRCNDLAGGRHTVLTGHTSSPVVLTDGIILDPTGVEQQAIANALSYVVMYVKVLQLAGTGTMPVDAGGRTGAELNYCKSFPWSRPP